MLDIKEKIKSDWLRMVFIGAGIVLALIAMILTTIATKNDGKVNVALVVVTVIAIVIAAATAIFDFSSLGKIVVVAMYMCAFGLFISTQAGNLGYALAGIHDIGNGIQPTFVAGEILYLVAIVLQSIAVFFNKTKNQSKGD